MNWEQVVTNRHSKRAFLDRPVPRELLERVLTAAAQAPSTRNGQPWQVAVVMGEARDALARRLCEEFDRGAPPRPDYVNRPPQTDAITERRRLAAGKGVLQAMGLAREDGEGRRAHLRANMDFYGAPTAMIFHLADTAVPATWLEMGFFLQNVMLGLVAAGLGSCPQYSVAGYPDTLRDQLGLDDDRLIVCALAAGFPDPADPVNAFVPARADLSDYSQWHDQPPSIAGDRTTCSHSLDRTS